MNDFDECEQKPPTEYIVFQCTKCEQYTYAKITQKGKKCPRCGRNHVVADVDGEIVKGPTNAMKLVKKVQNGNHKLANFKTSKESITFQPTIDPLTNKPLLVTDNAQLNRLLEIIVNWQKNESISLDVGFPEYMLEYIAKEIEPNTKQRNILIKKLANLEKFTRLSSGNVYMGE